jgi:hypothetical protein
MFLFIANNIALIDFFDYVITTDAEKARVLVII